MTTRYEAHRPRYEELGESGRALFDAIVSGPRAAVPGQFGLRSSDGSLAGPFGLFLLSPPLGGPLQELGAAIRTASSLSPRVRELVTLAAAVAARSTFELTAHIPLALKAGVTGEDIDAVLRCEPLADPIETALTAFARQNVLDPAPQDEFDALAPLVPDRTLVDVIVIAGYYRTVASLLALLGAGPTEGVC